MNNIDVESGDILRLIQHHLTECGLHESCRILREESGIGASATFSNVKSLASAGRWGEVLSALSLLDPRKIPLMTPELVADVHEMAILELTEVGEMEIAYASLRLLSNEELGGRFSSIERRIQEMDALRKQQNLTMTTTGDPSSSGTKTSTPLDYYGRDNISRQKRRDDIAKRLSEAIPTAPRGRLLTLLQQSIKWQSHTGQLPMMERTNNDEDDGDHPMESNTTTEDKPKKKKSKRARHNQNTTFDLVLGEAALPTPSSSSSKSSKSKSSLDQSVAEKIPSREAGKIKFGTKTQPQCAMFLPNGQGLVTGSSDGFIEIWDTTTKWGKLRTSDLIYQQNEEFMLHDASVGALAHSKDGTMLASGSSDGMVKVWNITNGKCLRIFPHAHAKAISALSLSRDGSHVLTASYDGLCREFGLRGSRMLKEFQGHGSYVNTCAYVYDSTHVASSQIYAVTASADGTVRVWDGKTSDIKHVIRPHVSNPSTSATTTTATTTMTAATASTNTDLEEGRNIHTVLHLHHPDNTMIVVPRGSKAFLMNYTGAILRIYARKDGIKLGGAQTGSDFVAATISPSNKWLYIATEDGLCLCFDVSTGVVESTLRIKEDNNEITGLVHHPHVGILGSFDNHKSSPGVLKLWK